MSDRSFTRGKCVFCKNDYSRPGMPRHLQACPERQAAIAAAKDQGTPEIQLYHLAIQDAYGGDYWMNLEIRADATLYELDRFLRDIWLECCGHMSSFDIAGQSYISSLAGWWNDEDQDMSARLDQVLSPGLEFDYQYDFGSTTSLKLRVVAERTGALAQGQKLQLMARNDPLEFDCAVCGQPATVICTFCEYTLLCNTCLEEHECGEDGLLPVVNSPRMGVCGYTGDAW